MQRPARIWGSFLFVSNLSVERLSRVGDLVDASTQSTPVADFRGTRVGETRLAKRTVGQLRYVKIETHTS